MHHRCEIAILIAFLLLNLTSNHVCNSTSDHLRILHLPIGATSTKQLAQQKIQEAREFGKEAHL